MVKFKLFSVVSPHYGIFRWQFSKNGHNSADDAFAAEFLTDLLTTRTELPVRHVVFVF